jgi:hypothetical protein
MLPINGGITTGLLLLLQYYLEKQEKDFGKFENPLFLFRDYEIWDCTCDGQDEDIHGPNCEFGEPNFRYKPENYELSWYKHIGRSMVANKEISVEEFHQIINTCILSLYPGVVKLFKL